MVGLVEKGKRDAIAVAANQDNTIVKALKTLISNHPRPFTFVLLFFNLNPIYRNTNLISNTTKLQEFSKFTKNASSSVLQHRPTHTI